jgi:hypothetical protein
VNLAQINEFRASQGLKPLQADPRKRERSVQLERNRRERAQASRDLKALRSKGK